MKSYKIYVRTISIEEYGIEASDARDALLKHDQGLSSLDDAPQEDSTVLEVVLDEDQIDSGV